MFGSLVVVRGWVVGPVFGSWVTAWVSSGCGFWRGCGLWVVDRRGWVVVVDQRAGMKQVVGCGSAAAGGRWSWIGELG